MTRAFADLEVEVASWPSRLVDGDDYEGETADFDVVGNDFSGQVTLVVTASGGVDPLTDAFGRRGPWASHGVQVACEERSGLDAAIMNCCAKAVKAVRS